MTKGVVCRCLKSPKKGSHIFVTHPASVPFPHQKGQTASKQTKAHTRSGVHSRSVQETYISAGRREVPRHAEPRRRAGSETAGRGPVKPMKIWPWVKSQIVPPVNIPIPKWVLKWVVSSPTPKWYHWFWPSHMGPCRSKITYRLKMDVSFSTENEGQKVNPRVPLDHKHA